MIIKTTVSSDVNNFIRWLSGKLHKSAVFCGGIMPYEENNKVWISVLLNRLLYPICKISIGEAGCNHFHGIQSL